MSSRFGVILGVLLSSYALAADLGKPRLLVLGFSANGGADPSVAQSLVEAVTTEISHRGYYQVLSAQDVQTLIGVERQRQLTGCSEGTSCLSELAGAIGAQFVLSGSVTRFGEAYQLNLQTLDSARAQPIGRSTRLAPSSRALLDTLPAAVAEATGTPLPPPPSRALPIALISVGTAAVLGGGALGFYAINNDTALSRELQTGEVNRSVLRPAADYQREADAIALQRTLALATMAVGAALIGAGVFALPSAATGSVEVALVPAPSGVAFVGVLR